MGMDTSPSEDGSVPYIPTITTTVIQTTSFEISSSGGVFPADVGSQLSNTNLGGFNGGDSLPNGLGPSSR